jgi:hypothetical protein|tara:strand:- start:51 stop:407 length:357 start_codon:yes stop_codon:yes gene_type:complete
MKDSVWKIFVVYLLFLFLLFMNSNAFGQINIVHCNATWNNKNKVTWLYKLSDVNKVKYIDIAKYPDLQKKYEIVVVPTVIIFNDGEEIKRFQADISFSIKAKLEDIQEIIDDILMESF